MLLKAKRDVTGNKRLHTRVLWSRAGYDDFHGLGRQERHLDAVTEKTAVQAVLFCKLDYASAVPDGLQPFWPLKEGALTDGAWARMVSRADEFGLNAAPLVRYLA